MFHSFTYKLVDAALCFQVLHIIKHSGLIDEKTIEQLKNLGKETAELAGKLS